MWWKCDENVLNMSFYNNKLWHFLEERQERNDKNIHKHYYSAVLETYVHKYILHKEKYKLYLSLFHKYVTNYLCFSMIKDKRQLC